ncbi:MAG: hypothetical protein AB7G93_23360 [Bdellovibrionales bacterium]
MPAAGGLMQAPGPRHFLKLKLQPRLTTIVGAAVVALALLVSPLQLFAKESGWGPITRPGQKECNAEEPCRVIQSDGAVFEVSLLAEPRGGKRILKSLEIRSLKTGHVQKFEPKEVNNIKSDESFGVYKANLRPGKNTDLALMAYSSAHEGPVYHYFLYNSARKEFVASTGTFPKLVRDSKTGKYLSEIQGAPYRLGSDLKFVEAEE